MARITKAQRELAGATRKHAMQQQEAASEQGLQTRTVEVGPIDVVVNQYELAKLIDVAVERALKSQIHAGPMPRKEFDNLHIMRDVIDAEVPAPAPYQSSGPGLRDQFFESRQRCEDRHQELKDDIFRLQQRVLELETTLYGSATGAAHPIGRPR